MEECTHPKDEEGDNTAVDNTTGNNNSQSEQPGNGSNSNTTDNRSNSDNGANSSNSDNTSQADNQDSDKVEPYWDMFDAGEDSSPYNLGFCFGNVLDGRIKIDSIKIKSVKINGIDCKFKSCSGAEKVKNELMKLCDVPGYGAYDAVMWFLNRHEEEVDPPITALYLYYDQKTWYDIKNAATEYWDSEYGNGKAPYWIIEIVTECSYSGGMKEYIAIERWKNDGIWDNYYRGDLSDLDW